jgi:hypothetical protein
LIKRPQKGKKLLRLEIRIGSVDGKARKQETPCRILQEHGGIKIEEELSPREQGNVGGSGEQTHSCPRRALAVLAWEEESAAVWGKQDRETPALNCLTVPAKR